MTDQQERFRIAAENRIAKQQRQMAREETIRRVLAYDPEITATALATRLGMKRSAMAEMVKRLGLKLQAGRR